MFPYGRLNHIFDYIIKEKIILIKNLCDLLNITDRPLRTDIQTINTILKNNGALIKLKRKSGYYIDILDNEKFNIFLNNLSYQKKSNIELDSSKDRTKYLLNILLYNNDYVSLDTLSEQVILTEDEIGYISLHIGAGIERCFCGSLKAKNVILVCGSGQATTRMLETSINIFFKDKINIINHISYNDFITYNKNDFINTDFII